MNQIDALDDAEGMAVKTERVGPYSSGYESGENHGYGTGSGAVRGGT